VTTAFHAINFSHRVRSGGRHSGHACYRSRHAAEDTEEGARPDDDGSLAHHAAADLLDVVPDSTSSGGDFGLGVVLSVVRMPARCRGGALLFQCYLHDHWLWRSGVGETMAGARADRGLDGHPDVRLVRGLLLRSCEPLYSAGTTREHWRWFSGRTIIPMSQLSNPDSSALRLDVIAGFTAAAVIPPNYSSRC
jgi:hypothetical protein